MVTNLTRRDVGAVRKRVGVAYVSVHDVHNLIDEILRQSQNLTRQLEVATGEREQLRAKLGNLEATKKQGGAAGGAGDGSNPAKRARPGDDVLATMSPDLWKHTHLWTGLQWTTSIISTIQAGYEKEVLVKLPVGESHTYKAIAQSIVRKMSTWVGRTPDEEDVLELQELTDRFYLRHIALTHSCPGVAVAAAASALSTANLPPRLKLAAEAADRAAALAVAGGQAHTWAGVAATTRGGGAVIRQAAQAAHAGPSGNGRGRGPGRGNRGGGGRGVPGAAPTNGGATATAATGGGLCWKCNQTGHKARDCPN